MMISARFLRDPSIHTAVLVRVAAFVATMASVVLIPAEFAAAATGHASTVSAFATAAVAASLTVILVVAARGLDPLRR